MTPGSPIPGLVDLFLLKEKLNWGKDEQIKDFNLSLLNSSSVHSVAWCALETFQLKFGFCQRLPSNTKPGKWHTGSCWGFDSAKWE